MLCTRWNGRLGLHLRLVVGPKVLHLTAGKVGPVLLQSQNSEGVSRRRDEINSPSEDDIRKMLMMDSTGPSDGMGFDDDLFIPRPPAPAHPSQSQDGSGSGSSTQATQVKSKADEELDRIRRSLFEITDT